jgi:hypothetical protein
VSTVYARRVLTPEEGTALVGYDVPDGGILVPGAEEDHPTFVKDQDTGETVVIVTRLDRGRASDLRRVVRATGMSGVARSQPGPIQKMSHTKGRTFGYSPKKVQVKKETCHEATLRRDHPDTAEVLADLADYLGRQFHDLLPDRAEADLAEVHKVRDDWFLSEHSLWTSGVINQTATLPYHRDGANFRTWSAMPSLRYRMNGGRLRIPEYGICLPIRDGEVSWFCGRDLVHGVTPMSARSVDGYRFTVVYYALRGLVDCRTYAEETGDAARLRTAREVKLASEL